MKNSQYVNTFSININEIARLCFMEKVNDVDTEIITVCMPLEAMKFLSKFIADIVKEHEEKNVPQAMKELN